MKIRKTILGNIDFLTLLSVFNFFGGGDELLLSEEPADDGAWGSAPPVRFPLTTASCLAIAPCPEDVPVLLGEGGSVAEEFEDPEPDCDDCCGGGPGPVLTGNTGRDEFDILTIPFTSLDVIGMLLMFVGLVTNFELLFAFDLSLEDGKTGAHDEEELEDVEEEEEEDDDEDDEEEPCFSRILSLRWPLEPLLLLPEDTVPMEALLELLPCLPIIG